jgi:hypothetical protein
VLKNMAGQFCVVADDQTRPTCRTNNASPETIIVAPPGRNSGNIASPPNANLQPANDLQHSRGAKLAEFRPTKKRKNMSEAKIKSPARYDSRFIEAHERCKPHASHIGA